MILVAWTREDGGSGGLCPFGDLIERAGCLCYRTTQFPLQYRRRRQEVDNDVTHGRHVKRPGSTSSFAPDADSEKDSVEEVGTRTRPKSSGTFSTSTDVPSVPGVPLYAQTRVRRDPFRRRPEVKRSQHPVRMQPLQEMGCHGGFLPALFYPNPSYLHEKPIAGCL
nr:hypothetical protein CFP56_21585 [Quercus suber]